MVGRIWSSVGSVREPVFTFGELGKSSGLEVVLSEGRRI